VQSFVRIGCVVCFASFGWGMIWHFRRVGGPSGEMIGTGVAGMVCAGLQIMALFGRLVIYPYIAVAMYGVSAALFWWAVSVTRGKLAACGQSFISPTVVTSGPYRYIRHPFYFAYNLAWFAGFVATGWWPTAATALLMAAIYERFAREEERGLLAGKCGVSYANYARVTGRYLPRRRQPNI
jgi:protein-S-isoprenylcysteine O-methyltransferase Ste14